MEISEREVEAFIDLWAHDFANDVWRGLTADEQIIAARSMMEAVRSSTTRGAVDPSSENTRAVFHALLDSWVPAASQGPWIERYDQAEVAIDHPRGGVDHDRIVDLENAATLLEEVGTDDFVNPPTAEAMQAAAVDLRRIASHPRGAVSDRSQLND